MNGLGLNGAQGSQDFTNAYRATPGYQAGLDTGTTAAMRGLNAGPGLQSGAALKALTRFGSDYEDQKSGNYINQLAGLEGQGLQATGAQTGLQAQGIGADTGIRQSAYGGDMTSAGTIGQGMVAGAQAQQQGVTNLAKIGLQGAGLALGGLGGFGGASSYLGNLMGGSNAPSYGNPYAPDPKNYTTMPAGNSWYS